MYCSSPSDLFLASWVPPGRVICLTCKVEVKACLGETSVLMMTPPSKVSVVTESSIPVKDLRNRSEHRCRRNSSLNTQPRPITASDHYDELSSRYEHGQTNKDTHGVQRIEQLSCLLTTTLEVQSLWIHSEGISRTPQQPRWQDRAAKSLKKRSRSTVTARLFGFFAAYVSKVSGHESVRKNKADPLSSLLPLNTIRRTVRCEGYGSKGAGM